VESIRFAIPVVYQSWFAVSSTSTTAVRAAVVVTTGSPTPAVAASGIEPKRTGREAGAEARIAEATRPPPPGSFLAGGAM